jgi:hypothetical protein
MSLTGLVPAEQEPRHVGKDDKRWFYVRRKICNFLIEHKGGDGVSDIQIPTMAIRRGLFAMDMQLAKQRAAKARKRGAKKGAR